MLEVIRTAAETQGYQVEGFAPTSRAAKQLEQAGIHSGTLRCFLIRSPESNSQRRKFFFIDESSLASTNQVRDFLRRLGNEDRVLLVGDTRQHQSVEASRPFQQLQEAGMKATKLEEIVRQKDHLLRSEVELLAMGQTARAIESLKTRGKVAEITDAQQRIQTIARNYVASPNRTLIVSPDNKSRQELNAAVREELKANRRVGGEDHGFRVLLPRQDMTGAERGWARRYETHDIVRFSRGSTLADIEAGTYGTVIKVNSSENLLTVLRQDGNQVTYDPIRLFGVTVYQAAERHFSTGDRIQFTAPHRSLGIANRELATIDTIDRNGNISIRLEQGAKIHLNVQDHRHFDYGYAVTSYSSQGLTADRVLINADVTAHPDLLNSRFAYVAVSRARFDAEIYTNDSANLATTLSNEVSKSAALDFPSSAVRKDQLGLSQDI